MNGKGVHIFIYADRNCQSGLWSATMQNDKQLLHVIHNGHTSKSTAIRYSYGSFYGILSSTTRRPSWISMRVKLMTTKIIPILLQTHGKRSTPIIQEMTLSNVWIWQLD